MKRKLFIVILLIAAGLAVWFWHSNRRETAAPTHLSLYGNVDIREVNLGFRVSGRVTEILKDEGDSVVAGETIARIDTAPYEQEVAQVKAVLAVSEAELARLTAGYRVEEIAQARATVNELEATLANNQVNAKRTAELLKQNASTQQDYDNANTAVITAEKRLQSAKASLDLLLAGYRVEDIEKARAQVAQNRAALDAARIRLSDTTLAAPSLGTISTRALEPGAIVQAGATVFTLSLDNPVWLRAYINEPDLGKIAPGMTVEVFTDSRPGRPYEGKIGFISPRAEFTPKTVQTESLRTTLVYRLRIIVTNPDNMLRQGMPVSVRVALAENEKLER